MTKPTLPGAVRRVLEICHLLYPHGGHGLPPEELASAFNITTQQLSRILRPLEDEYPWIYRRTVNKKFRWVFDYGELARWLSSKPPDSKPPKG